MLNEIRADIERLREVPGRPWPWFFIEAMAFDSGFQAVLFYRVARACRERGIPFLGPFLARLGLFLTGADISPAAEIGGGLRLAHSVGLVVGGGVRLGRGAKLLHGVTIGARRQNELGRMPVAGDNLFMGAGASLLGPITVGVNCFIGAHTLVTQDLPDNTRVVSAAAIQLLTQHADRP